MRLAASTLGYRHDTLNVALREIAGSGFTEIDIGAISSYCPHFDVMGANEAAATALEAEVADLGLKVMTLNTGEGKFGDPKSQDRGMEGMKKALVIAQRLGCYAITVPSGPEPQQLGETFSEVAGRAAPLFREVCDLAARMGIDIAVEIHKQALAYNTQTALDLAAKVDHPAFGFTLDPSHITHAGELTDRAARQLRGLVRHVHLRDAVGKVIMVVPGDGTVDFAAVAAALREIGYARACAIELEYEHARAATVTPDLWRAKALLSRSFQS
jgi:sugar phosphate isomerase/epimerase